MGGHGEAREVLMHLAGMASEPLAIPGDHCVVHGYHRPVPARTVRHHIIPMEFDGPTNNENLVLICDTGHYNVHAYIDAVLKNRVPPKVTRKERALALAALAAIKEKA